MCERKLSRVKNICPLIIFLDNQAREAISQIRVQNKYECNENIREGKQFEEVIKGNKNLA